MAVAAPSLNGARKGWEEAEREEAFWVENYARFLEQYPDEFVAVYKGQVVAAGPDLRLLLEALTSKRIALLSVWLRFITADPRCIVV